MSLAWLRAPADHVPALTGLRGIAAGWVLIYHLWQSAGSPRMALGPIDLTPLFACGFFGVDLFFVLSGFLLGQPFVAARMQERPLPGLRRFWWRRFRRVLPAYWFQIAVLVALAAFGIAGKMPGGFELLGHLTLSFNLVDNASRINPVYWSLPVEWDFYLVLPLLALGFVRGSGRPWMLPLAILFALGFRLLCAWSVNTWGADGVGVYRWILQLPARLDQFVFGMGAAWLCLRGFDGRTRNLLALAGIGLILMQAWLTAPRGDFLANVDLAWTWWHYSVLGLGFACLIAAAAHVQTAWPARLFSGPVLGWMGLISYSLYLWHYPILGWLRPLARQPEIGPLWIWCMIAPLLALLAATLSWLLVERPFQRTPRPG